MIKSQGPPEDVYVRVIDFGKKLGGNVVNVSHATHVLHQRLAKGLYSIDDIADIEELDGGVQEMVVEVLEFGKDGERVDLINGTLHIGYHKLFGEKVVEGISSIQVLTEDNFPIGILRKNGTLHHVVKLEIKGNHAKAIVKTRR